MNECATLVTKSSSKVGKQTPADVAQYILMKYREHEAVRGMDGDGWHCFRVLFAFKVTLRDVSNWEGITCREEHPVTPEVEAHYIPLLVFRNSGWDFAQTRVGFKGKDARAYQRCLAHVCIL